MSDTPTLREAAGQRELHEAILDIWGECEHNGPDEGAQCEALASALADAHESGRLDAEGRLRERYILVPRGGSDDFLTRVIAAAEAEWDASQGPHDAFVAGVVAAALAAGVRLTEGGNK